MSRFFRSIFNHIGKIAVAALTTTVVTVGVLLAVPLSAAVVSVVTVTAVVSAFVGTLAGGMWIGDNYAKGLFLEQTAEREELNRAQQDRQLRTAQITVLDQSSNGSSDKAMISSLNTTLETLNKALEEQKKQAQVNQKSNDDKFIAINRHLGELQATVVQISSNQGRQCFFGGAPTSEHTPTDDLPTRTSRRYNA